MLWNVDAQPVGLRVIVGAKYPPLVDRTLFVLDLFVFEGRKASVERHWRG